MASVERELTFKIQGMDCAGCARTVESGVAQLPGVESCELNATTERLRVRGSVAAAVVAERVRALGYEALAAETAAPSAPAPAPSLISFLWGRGETRLALLGALLVLPGAVLHEIFGWELLWVDLLALVALVVAGLPVARAAWRSLTVSRELTINGLMTIAAVGAVVIGAYVEAGMVMVLFAIGEALEGYSTSRARHAIRSLMALAPETAARLLGGREERVPVAALAVGDVILVRPGERIAMDGTVLAGLSSVNQAPITGESRPVDKAPGAELFAGSINGEGALEVAVSRPASDSTISRMIRLVQEAQERRAPAQRMVDQFARWYTPAVVVIALLTAVLPSLLFGQPFWNPTPDEFGWLYRGLALLVVACPCALVISTPVSVISALSAAARGGVLIKGGAALEALGRVRAVAFDKTGTLTAGRPAVVAVRPVGCDGPGDGGVGHCAACDEVLALAYAVERRSEHPLAFAIMAAAEARGLAGALPAAEQVVALPGRGVSGLVGGRHVSVGSHRHFDETVPHTVADCGAAERDAGKGRTPLLVSVDGRYVGTISVADAVRPSSRAAVARLRSLGVRAVAMLTGDHRDTARAIAAEVGVDDVRAELLPEGKVAAVATLERTFGPVAMVGDGINDAPALATAAVGVAIGGAHGGTTQAMETADVTLMSDDLRRLPFALRLSRAALRTIGINVALSIGIKLLFLVAVLLGYGTMWMAVLADMGTSLLVTLYGLRLLRFRDAEAE